MPEIQKRNIAYKYRIGNLIQGKPIVDGERFSFLEHGNRKVVRVNVIGNVVDKYESEATEAKAGYCFTTIDDGSGQISLKLFGEDSKKLRNTTQGNTVVVIGTLRFFNNQLYINPEIIRIVQPEYLLLRKLELEKTEAANKPLVAGREQIIAVKDNILTLIKGNEENGGIEVDKIIMHIKDSSPELINQEIQKLLEEGIIFEPRPGKLRFLG